MRPAGVSRPSGPPALSSSPTSALEALRRSDDAFMSWLSTNSCTHLNLKGAELGKEECDRLAWALRQQECPVVELTLSKSKPATLTPILGALASSSVTSLRLDGLRIAGIHTLQNTHLKTLGALLAASRLETLDVSGQDFGQERDQGVGDFLDGLSRGVGLQRLVLREASDPRRRFDDGISLAPLAKALEKQQKMLAEMDSSPFGLGLRELDLGENLHLKWSGVADFITTLQDNKSLQRLYLHYDPDAFGCGGSFADKQSGPSALWGAVRRVLKLNRTLQEVDLPWSHGIDTLRPYQKVQAQLALNKEDADEQVDEDWRSLQTALLAMRATYNPPEELTKSIFAMIRLNQFAALNKV